MLAALLGAAILAGLAIVSRNRRWDPIIPFMTITLGIEIHFAVAKASWARSTGSHEA